MHQDDPLRGTLTALTDRIQVEMGRLIDDLATSHQLNTQRTLDATRALDSARSLGEVLDTLVDHAGREGVRASITLMRDPTVPPVAASAATAIPIELAGHLVATLNATRPDGVSIDQELQSRLELLARHAARCLESITALRTARYVADRMAWPPAHADASEREPAAGELLDPDARQAAHRYARLLIAEIKMYHEATIATGRRQRDLMSRLGGEIARAQAMYDERIPERVRRATDFFRAELVRTLAGGDESLLQHN
jgi:hypothetical protein